MALIPFPNVPLAPGVPALARSVIAAIPTAPAALSADDSSISSASAAAPQWGIFSSSDGSPIIVSDSVVGCAYDKEYRVSDYPLETGAFQSYNKVETPFEAHFDMTRGGSDADRSDFLSTLDQLIRTFDLYAVVTPEITYPSVTIERYDYERTAKVGATLITARVWLRQVRVTATQQFSQTKAVSGIDAVNDGTVATTTLSASQTTTGGGAT